MRRVDLWLLVGAAVIGISWFLYRLPQPSAVTKPVELTVEERGALARTDRVLGKDMIAPIYTPRFVRAADARLRTDELVLGVEIDGAAKAYPITVLQSREMVNDELHGVPILVTW